MNRYGVHRWRSGLLCAGALFLTLPGAAQVFEESALKEHIRLLTADSLAGRGVGTEGEKKAAAYISRSFGSYGLEFIYPNGIQDFSVVGPQGDTLSSQNIVAILPGSDPVLREEYIVIGAHYDHIGSEKIVVNGRDSLVVYPGADDNASGVAVVLEMARMAAKEPYLFRRSLVFVAFGAQEMGMVGSWYFVHRAFSPITQTVLMVNIDMVGRSGSKNPFSAYTVAPDVALTGMLLSVNLPPQLLPKVVDTDYFPSDHQIFFLHNIPALLFTSGLHADYHRPGDKPHLLDYGSMSQRTGYFYAFVQQVANMEDLSSIVLDSKGGAGQTYTLAEVEKRPRFQNRDESQFLPLWVHKYLRYPSAAISQGIQGQVLVQFIVEADGSVTHVEVVESVDPLLDEEAIRVVAASPKWKPGVINRKPVRVKMRVPVQFLLKRR